MATLEESKLARYEKIIAKVVTKDIYVEDNYGREYCFYCIADKGKDHFESCIWVMAKELDQERIADIRKRKNCSDDDWELMTKKIIEDLQTPEFEGIERIKIDESKEI